MDEAKHPALIVIIPFDNNDLQTDRMDKERLQNKTSRRGVISPGWYRGITIKLIRKSVFVFLLLSNPNLQAQTYRAPVRLRHHQSMSGS